MKKFIKEPLLHFLLMGFGLFLVYGYFNKNISTDPQRIIVDRQQLLTYVQFRSKRFDPSQKASLLDNMSEAELSGVIDDYVREEALYREAKAMQLDKNDYMARRRIIQQLEFVTRDYSETEVEVSDQEIHNYYQAHKDNYYVEPCVTFTHVFFSKDRFSKDRFSKSRGDGQSAKQLANTMLHTLNNKPVAFSEGSAFGDRFLYQVNYVERTQDEIDSHFGKTMGQTVFGLEPSDSEWRGPYESPYGFHLVMLTKHQQGYYPKADDIWQRLEQDAERAALEAKQAVLLEEIVSKYKVDIVGPLRDKNQRNDS